MSDLDQSAIDEKCCWNGYRDLCSNRGCPCSCHAGPQPICGTPRTYQELAASYTTEELRESARVVREAVTGRGLAAGPSFQVLLAYIEHLEQDRRRREQNEGESRAYQAAAMVGYTEDKWRQRVAALQEALEPFVRLDVDGWCSADRQGCGGYGGEPVPGWHECTCPRGKARALLAEKDKES